MENIHNSIEGFFVDSEDRTNKEGEVEGEKNKECENKNNNDCEVNIKEEKDIPSIKDYVLYQENSEAQPTVHQVLGISYNSFWGDKENAPFLGLTGVYGRYISHKKCKKLDKDSQDQIK